jgi:pSer/pThr/pTyr-binding forkhead associated (FHA) protein
MEVKLEVAQGMSKGRKIPLPPTVFLIGRGNECHLRLHCHLVSKLHCAIACWAGKVVVRDLKSANGTFINDQLISGEARVRDGDRLGVGSLTFTFRVNVEWEPDMPVPVVRRGDVRWLLESADDAAVVNAAETQSFEFSALVRDAAGLVDRASKATLSAGQYLHDYFQRSGT